MPRFRTTLVAGRIPPYDTWVFAPVPEEVRRLLGSEARLAVRGTVDGAPFRSTIQKGDGMHRFAVTRAVRTAAGVAVGATVEVSLTLDTASREVPVPAELRSALVAERLEDDYQRLPPAHRRAWAEHVTAAKQSATRMRRAQRAIEGVRRRMFPGQKA
jgi:hypothetical protein